MANGLTIHDKILIFKDVSPRFSLSTPFRLPSVACFPSPPPSQARMPEINGETERVNLSVEAD